jgi:hypothetical protein
MHPAYRPTFRPTGLFPRARPPRPHPALSKRVLAIYPIGTAPPARTHQLAYRLAAPTPGNGACSLSGAWGPGMPPRRRLGERDVALDAPLFVL